MPRDLVLGNGSLLAAFDRDLSLRDLYWPLVGMPNHLSGHYARLGVWVDGRFAWSADPTWERTPEYLPGTLVTNATLHSAELGIRLTVQDCVYHRADILLRRFGIEDLAGRGREVRLFLGNDLHIAETDIGDTAFYDPFADAVIHYKRSFYFLAGGAGPEGGLHQYATGIKGFGGAEGTWRDAEDGELSGNAVAQGSVDSVISVRALLDPHGRAEARAWLCAGPDHGTVRRLHTMAAGRFNTLLQNTRHYWMAWSDRDQERVSRLPPAVAALFRRSLLVMRTNIDRRGAIIAANDSDIMQTARAHYSYMWPRDGALVADALDRLGFEDISRRFFLFCGRVLPKDRAVLLHKYSADGSWGATWHPWVVQGMHEVPFQEDSTALVLWALWRHYERCRDLEFVESVYDEMVLPCADFIAEHRDPATGLPLPSYDLWEERRGVHAYTCATVHAALTAAANLSAVFEDGHAERYREAAQAVRKGMEEHLWDAEANRFARRLILSDPGSTAAIERDLTIDSALYGLFAFGAFGADDPRIQSTMRAFITRLWVQSDVGGMARYEGDYYFRRSEDTGRVPGNPWLICTLWAAQWFVAQAHSVEELVPAMELLMWACRHALPSGVLPEQLHPYTGEPLSVAPLTWSHAEFVATVLDYLDRQDALSARPV
ncbi:MAG: glycoside hydrolase family 15 protein [Chthonomonadales bacterium]|nr:glycoside hydrolase family 15 protein [Chthonomonadales bacterium]